MTKYTILETCPLGRKGEEVETDVDGCVTDKNMSWYATPFDIFFSLKLNIIKEKDETPKKWEPYLEEKYFYVTSAGEVSESDWFDLAVDNLRLAFGNVFKTREEAEAKAEEVKVVLLK